MIHGSDICVKISGHAAYHIIILRMSDVDAAFESLTALNGLLGSIIGAVLDPMSSVIFAALHQPQSSAINWLIV